MDFYDILNIEEEETDGISFELDANFRIVDIGNCFALDIHKLFKRSYKGFESSVDFIIQKNPLSISNISNIDIEDFKINKLYRGNFKIDFYDDKKFDIFLKNYLVI